MRCGKNIVQWGRLQITIWCMLDIQGHTYTHNMQYLLVFHCSSGSKYAPERYVTRTLAVLLQDEITI